MKYYITKYAITRGVIEIDGEVSENSRNNMVKQLDTKYQIYYFKPYWHESKEDAIKHANLLKAKKVASMQKQIEKIKAMTF